MSAGRDILSEISHQLGRRFTISDLDLASGTFRLSDRSGSVAVTWEPDLLVAFYEQLSETEPPGLDDSRPDEQRQVLNGYVVTWVAELLESDSGSSQSRVWWGWARRCPGRGRGLPMMGVLTQPIRKTSTCLTLPSIAPT